MIRFYSFSIEYEFTYKNYLINLIGKKQHNILVIYKF